MEDQIWESSDTSRKILSQNCVRLRFFVAKECYELMPSGKCRLRNRFFIGGAINMAAWEPTNRKNLSAFRRRMIGYVVLYQT